MQPTYRTLALSHTFQGESNHLAGLDNGPWPRRRRVSQFAQHPKTSPVGVKRSLSQLRKTFTQDAPQEACARIADNLRGPGPGRMHAARAHRAAEYLKKLGPQITFIRDDSLKISTPTSLQSFAPRSAILPPRRRRERHHPGPPCAH